MSSSFEYVIKTHGPYVRLKADAYMTPTEDGEAFGQEYEDGSLVIYNYDPDELVAYFAPDDWTEIEVQ